MTDDLEIENYQAEIEDGIPAPETRSRGSKYPIARLKIGQSIWFPAKSAAKVKGLRNTLMAAARVAKPQIFMTARPEMGEIKGKKVHGVRVWRLADRHTGGKK